jgi:hypothetical protein
VIVDCVRDGKDGDSSRLTQHDSNSKVGRIAVVRGVGGTKKGAVTSGLVVNVMTVGKAESRPSMPSITAYTIQHP